MANERNTPTASNKLAAFDFDHTIVNTNSDTVVRDMIKDVAIPRNLEDIIDKQGWTEYMQEVFRFLHVECQVTEAQIREVIRKMPEVPGYVKLLKELRKQGYDIVIISDSNSIFIEEWLQSHGLMNCVKKVFTNPARFDDSGLLLIERYHNQTECKISAENLCKGKVLREFMKCAEVPYDRVVYAGDGNNDICPVLKLTRGDYACVRIGYGMAKNIKKNPNIKVKAKILYWNEGFDLMRQLHEEDLIE